MKRLLRILTTVIVCSGLALWSACDSATPTAPSGTVLTISANPGQISLTGSSQITVIGRRPDGNPLNKGTEIFFTTDRGTIGPTVVAVDENGIARATLQGDGRAGTAMVQASVSTAGGGGEGGGGGTATVSVQIGVDPDTRPELLISASPSTVFVQETSEITVIARNSDGSSVGAGETIILTTTLGTISPSRPRTDSDGTATATLEAGSQPGSAEVTAILGSSQAVSTTVTIQDTVTSVSVLPQPSSIPSTGGTITIDAFAVNSQGEPVPGRQMTFASARGTFANDDNVDFTDTQGQATVTLTVTQQQLMGVSEFTVSAQTGGGEGGFVTGVAVVDVEGQ